MGCAQRCSARRPTRYTRREVHVTNAGEGPKLRYLVSLGLIFAGALVAFV